MAIITTGTTFSGPGDDVTSSKLNNIADAATFNDPVDDSSLELINGGTNNGKLGIKDSGVTFAKLTDVINDDTMATATADTLATSESIKSYVDTTVDNLLSIKAHCVWDGTLTGTNAPISGSGVANVTRNGNGNWTINMSVAAPSSSFTTLASSQAKSNGTTNNATGAYSTSTTTAEVTREQANGSGADGDTPISFAAIW